MGIETIPDERDQFEIRQALSAYCGGIDTKDYELFRSAFTTDVFAEYGEWCGPFDGIEPLAAYMEAVHRDLDGTLHRITNFHFVDFDGESARVRSYVSALLVDCDHPDGESFTANGMYMDELRRTGSGWRICRKRYDHLWGRGNANVLDPEPANRAVAALGGGDQSA